ncbi:hypothetical protein Ccrd_024653 [Cynara cardunculus var. scolymus]|uniref:AB hydrolase-1 domain-containing protein n=1 Tax=Cynara cardunculus var. scolymus TaxID=59895 RepID=A0A103XC26_CYNCS|nr:hypothetical protein Ccrd_024653 [Cynara cardunculus var. scolymus]
MSAAVLKFSVCRRHTEASSLRIRSNLKPFAVINCKLPNISRFSQSGTLCIQLSPKGQSRRPSTSADFQMTLVDESIGRGKIVIKPSEILAYDLVQGPLVRWSYIADKSVPCPPTAVLLHGILGSRKNWAYSSCSQFLLVDLRCHGDSASITKTGPHTVCSAALDVLKLLGHLRVTPRVIIGHSFGGKVALSMVEQAAKPLARPVRVWVLDATPGKVRAGRDGDDHPAELITFLSALPKEVVSKREIIHALVREGFSNDVAQWVVTNLRQTNPSDSSPGFSWTFDLDGIAEMYQSYEETNLSLHRWALGDLQRIHAAEEQAAEEGGGVEMHVLEDAGHWVHADNPDGLFRILSFSFQGM